MIPRDENVVDKGKNGFVEILRTTRDYSVTAGRLMQLEKIVFRGAGRSEEIHYSLFIITCYLLFDQPVIIR